VTSLDEAIDKTLLELPAIRVRGRALLDRVAAAQRSSAVVLRFHGRETDARRAEQAAVRLEAALEDPRATTRMFGSSQAVLAAGAPDEALRLALEGAMSLLGADSGNVQLRDSESGALRIVAHSGFDSEFLEHFAVVADDASACGRAAGQRAQVVIEDVDDDEAFAPHRHIASASRFRAVQSTPLVDGTDRLVGVISTHFRLPHRPSATELLLIGWYGERIGDVVAGYR
jgi:hypothetical protein